MRKIIIMLFFPLAVQMAYSGLTAAENLPPLRVGVAQNQFDRVDLLLKKYQIDHSMITYRDLEKESLYKKYDVLFFPCGVELPLTSSVNILSRGIHLEGVTLNDQYYKINMKLTGKYIREFIEDGGSAYFSDFSFRYLQEAFPVFSFYKDFPYTGMAGQVKAAVSGELSSYIEGSLYLNLSHSGWVVPSDIKESIPVLSGDCETPLGIKNAPLSSLIKREKGLAVFTTYHDVSDPFGIMRYLIMRTVYKRTADEAEGYVRKWEQNLLSLVVDKSLSGESARQYRLKAGKGSTYIYFRTDSGEWQVDIFDAKGAFLYSKENTGNEFIYKIKMPEKCDVIVKITPIDSRKFRVYSVASAGGFRIFPYYLHILIGAAGFLLLCFYMRVLKRQRFKGRVRVYDAADSDQADGGNQQ
ncbi:MAG: hypothetical protein ACRCUT_13815 [Spirochaetota bacterium]